jgi:glycosyltransferase involved in cell wall biosynthesis
MAQRIKVIHLVTRMNVGGVAVLIDNLMNNFDLTEVEPVLITGRCEFPEREYLDGKPVGYTVMKIDSLHKSFALLDDFKAFIKIAGFIRKFKPDVIHTHTSKAGLFGRISGLLFYPRAKRVHTFHGHLLVGYFSPIALSLVKFIEHNLGLISSRLIAMGTQVRNDLCDAGIAPKSKFKVFFPGLRLLKTHDRLKSRKVLNLDAEKIYCVYVGRLTQIKRPDRLLEVVEIVSAQNKSVEFLVVGDGDLSQEIKNVANRKQLPMQFLGWREDIDAILAASDIAILVSDNEAVALTLIEASQAGLPIVTTPAGSVRDIAVDQLNALVADFTASDLASNILKLATDPSLRKQLGDAGRVLADEKFSIHRMVSSHVSLYKELLRK